MAPPFGDMTEKPTVGGLDGTIKAIHPRLLRVKTYYWNQPFDKLSGRHGLDQVFV